MYVMDFAGMGRYFNKSTGGMQFMEGSVQCNLLLGDEINRTSAKTQSVLLKAMEENKQ